MEATGAYDETMGKVFTNLMEDLSHFEETGVDGVWFYGLLLCRNCRTLSAEAYSGGVPLSHIRCQHCSHASLMKLGRLSWKHLGGK